MVNRKTMAMIRDTLDITHAMVRLNLNPKFPTLLDKRVQDGPRLSVTEKSFPVSSRLSSTPNEANHFTVCSTEKAASTFLMIWRLPKKLVGATIS